MHKLSFYLPILFLFLVSCGPEEGPSLTPDQRKSFGMYETFDFNEIMGDIHSIDQLEENASLLSHLRPGQDAIIGYTTEKEMAIIDSILTADTAIKLLPKEIIFAWSSSVQETGKGPKMFALYALKNGKRDPRIVNKHLKTAYADVDMNTGQNTVMLSMTQKGAELWGEMTTDNVMRSLAMVVDGRVYFCPRVNEPITAGQTQITGTFTRQDAELLAAQILP